MKPVRYMKRRGFTLIELLVVIAIIAILAAILFPVFATARDKARQATCASNEKQIGIGMTMYKQDYDECYPLTYWNGSSWVPYGVVTFETVTYPYIKSTNVWMCPSSSNAPGSYALWPITPGGSATNISDYTINAYILSYNSTTQPLNDAKIPQPSSIIAVAENTTNAFAVAVVNDTWNNVWQTPSTSSCAWTSWNCERQGFPHNDGANYLFCDAHVKYLPEALGGSPSSACVALWGRSTASGTPFLYN
ncbi:MAG: prepilin-type N-terminal cleavage/methylation domain-containing protein [Capsulimonadaceae bacterium]|nr:prepilin-type N-terminal cleavage/methylation domain-containing protein [Capsulimonadaceae bacterium]